MVSRRYAQVLAGRWRLLCVGFVLAVFALLSGVGVPLAKLDRGSDKQWVPAGGKLADQIDFMAPYEEANRERENTYGYIIAKPRDGGNVLDDPAEHLEALYYLLKHIATSASLTTTLEWEDLSEDEQARRMDRTNNATASGEEPPDFRDQWELTYSRSCYSIDHPLFLGWFDGGAPCINQSPLDCFSEGMWEIESQNKSFQLKTLVDFFNNASPLNPWWHYPGYTESFRSLDREQIVDKLGRGCESWFKLNRLPLDKLLAGYEKHPNGTLKHVEGFLGHLNQAAPRFNVAQRGYPITPAKMKEVNDQYLLELERIIEAADADTQRFPRTTFSFFPSNAVDRMYDELGESRLTQILTGYAIMFAYVIYSQFSLDKARNLAVVGVLGTLCVVLANLSAYGLVAIMGIVFNHTMLQALPFLALGLGVDDMFLLLHTYAGVEDKATKSREEIIAETLKEGGASVTVTSACNAAAFFAGCVVPIPALRSFLIGAGVVVILNFVLTITCLPVLLSFQVDFEKRTLASQGVAKHAGEMTQAEAVAAAVATKKSADKSIFNFLGTEQEVIKGFAVFMQQLHMRLIVFAGFVTLVSFCAISISKVEFGTEFKDLAADGTFLRRGVVDAYDQIFSQHVQEKWVVRDTFDYPTRWHELVQLYADLKGSKWVYEDNSLDFLASILANSHWIDHMWQACPGLWGVDRRIPGVSTRECQEEDPLVKGELFYKVFHHWRNPNNGPNALYAMQDGAEAFGYTTNVTDLNNLNNTLVMSTSMLPIDMRMINNTQDKIDLITDLRDIMNASGIDAFPYGDNIIQIEQFISLGEQFWQTVGVSVPCVLGACLLVGMSVAASITVATSSLMILIEVYGALGIFGFRFDAMQAVCLLMCIGMAVEYTAHLITAYEYSIGTRKEKVIEALLRTGMPILQGGISSFLGFVPLSVSPFPYVRANFFFVYLILILLGCLNGVVILPALLGLFGWTSADDFPDADKPDSINVPRKRRSSSIVIEQKRRASLENA